MHSSDSPGIHCLEILGAMLEYAEEVLWGEVLLGSYRDLMAQEYLEEKPPKQRLSQSYENTISSKTHQYSHSGQRVPSSRSMHS